MEKENTFATYNKTPAEMSADDAKINRAPVVNSEVFSFDFSDVSLRFQALVGRGRRQRNAAQIESRANILFSARAIEMFSV